MLKTVCGLARWRRFRSILIALQRSSCSISSFGALLCIYMFVCFYLCLSNGRDISIGSGADARRENDGGINNTGTEEVFFSCIAKYSYIYSEKQRMGLSDCKKPYLKQQITPNKSPIKPTDLTDNKPYILPASEVPTYISCKYVVEHVCI